jgi:hypothetical protein
MRTNPAVPPLRKVSVLDLIRARIYKRVPRGYGHGGEFSGPATEFGRLIREIIHGGGHLNTPESRQKIAGRLGTVSDPSLHGIAQDRGLNLPQHAPRTVVESAILNDVSRRGMLVPHGSGHEEHELHAHERARQARELPKGTMRSEELSSEARQHFAIAKGTKARSEERQRAAKVFDELKAAREARHQGPPTKEQTARVAKPLKEMSAEQAAQAARDGRVDKAEAAAHIRAQADEADRAAATLRRPDTGTPDLPTGRQRSLPHTEQDRMAAAARREVEARRLRAMADRVEGGPAPAKKTSRRAGVTPQEFEARHLAGTRAGLSDVEAGKYARSDFDSPRAWREAHPAKAPTKAVKATPAKRVLWGSHPGYNGGQPLKLTGGTDREINAEAKRRKAEGWDVQVRDEGARPSEGFRLVAEAGGSKVVREADEKARRQAKATPAKATGVPGPSKRERDLLASAAADREEIARLEGLTDEGQRHFAQGRIDRLHVSAIRAEEEAQRLADARARKTRPPLDLADVAAKVRDARDIDAAHAALDDDRLTPSKLRQLASEELGLSVPPTAQTRAAIQLWLATAAKATPAKATPRPAKPDRAADGYVNAATARQHIVDAKSPEDARRYLDSLDMSQAEARRLARDLGVRQQAAPPMTGSGRPPRGVGAGVADRADAEGAKAAIMAHFADNWGGATPRPAKAATPRTVDRENPLANLDAQELGRVAREVNVQIPAPARSAEARRRFLTETLTDHERRTGGGSTDPEGRARRRLADAAEAVVAGRAQLTDSDMRRQAAATPRKATGAPKPPTPRQRALTAGLSPADAAAYAKWEKEHPGESVSAWQAQRRERTAAPSRETFIDTLDAKNATAPTLRRLAESVGLTVPADLRTTGDITYWLSGQRDHPGLTDAVGALPSRQVFDAAGAAAALVRDIPFGHSEAQVPELVQRLGQYRRRELLAVAAALRVGIPPSLRNAPGADRDEVLRRHIARAIALRQPSSVR